MALTLVSVPDLAPLLVLSEALEDLENDRRRKSFNEKLSYLVAWCDSAPSC